MSPPLPPPPPHRPHPSLGCVSFPTRFNEEEVCTCPQASVPKQFASVPWNSFSRDVLRALYGFAPISMHCNKSSAVRFQVRKPWRLPLYARGPTEDPSMRPARKRSL